MTEPTSPPDVVRWSRAQRFTLRFLVAYFALLLVTDPLADFLPYRGAFIRAHKAFWLPIVTWVARHVLHTSREIYLVAGDAGVSNTLYGSILFLCYAALAAVAAVLWSALDRKRQHYRRLHQWLRYLVRASLALAMIRYGVLKALPTQMIAPPPLSVLLQRVGSLPPMRMLWIFMGSSPAYESITGCAELLGGLLLLVPRTTLLGALVCTADLLMVVTLNFCYDVHVKLYALHLLGMALLLLAPDLPRLADLLLWNRRVEPAVSSPLFARPGLNRLAQVLLLLVGLYSVGTNWAETRARYQQFHPPRPPFYGVWSVEEFVVDGKDVPLNTAPDRWRWVTFQRPGALTVELMIGAHRGYSLALDLQNRRLRLGAPQPVAQPVAGFPPPVPGPPAELTFATPAPDLLVLDGSLGGHPTHITLRLSPLLATGFRWIFEPPPEDR
ncbi:MAG TPA: hypothetical protein VMM92_14645 [Thermoanaerobaculia bacterium]|nr:hypothetical protein [Thermoanaerobaculia bacterium]